MLKKADLISRTCVVLEHMRDLWQKEQDSSTRAAFLYEYVCPMILTISLFSSLTKDRATQFLDKYAKNPDEIDEHERNLDAKWLWERVMLDYQAIRKLNFQI